MALTGTPPAGPPRPGSPTASHLRQHVQRSHVPAGLLSMRGAGAAERAATRMWRGTRGGTRSWACALGLWEGDFRSGGC